jgi:succinoglycan biosynthesis protein ExoU
MPAGHDDSVCVCIAAYNSERTIARAVKSALEQSHVTEVIVVDDASKDATAAAARSCDDGSGRLSVIIHERNGGPSAARNTALAQSRAAIFCVLDSDDYFVSDRIGRLLGTRLGAWDFLADDILIVPENLLDTAPVRLAADAPSLLLDLDLPTFVLSNIPIPGRARGELGFLKPLIRRRFLSSHDLTYNVSMRLGEDYALYVRALMAGARFRVVGFSGYIAVERPNSLSASHRAAELEAILTFDKACVATPGLNEASRKALAGHLRATTDRWALARALEIRRKEGVAAALHFLSKRPGSAPYVASRVIRARSERFCQRLGATQKTQRSRHLIDRKIAGAG